MHWCSDHKFSFRLMPQLLVTDAIRSARGIGSVQRLLSLQVVAGPLSRLARDFRCWQTTSSDLPLIISTHKWERKVSILQPRSSYEQVARGSRLASGTVGFRLEKHLRTLRSQLIENNLSQYTCNWQQQFHSGQTSDLICPNSAHSTGCFHGIHNKCRTGSRPVALY